MKREQILNIIKELAKSQGFYGRLYMDLLYCKNNHEDEYEEFMSVLESKNFNDPVDLVIFLEC